MYHLSFMFKVCQQLRLLAGKKERKKLPTQGLTAHQSVWRVFPCGLYSKLDLGPRYLSLPAAPDRVITAGEAGNHWANSPAHLQHSLIKLGARWKCVRVRARALADTDVFYHTAADPLLKTFPTFSFFRVPL